MSEKLSYVYIQKLFYVYILSNQRNGTLYIGVTNDLSRRVWQHKQRFVEGFTKKYDLNMLVWYDIFEDISIAIQKEKQLKKWNRKWKLRIIEKMNPDWNDFYLDLNN